MPNDVFNGSGVTASSLARDVVQDRPFARMGSSSPKVMHSAIGVLPDEGSMEIGRPSLTKLWRALILESRLSSFGSDFPRETCGDGFRWSLLDRMKISIRSKEVRGDGDVMTVSLGVHSAVKKEGEYIGNSRQGFLTLCKYNEISDTVRPLIRRTE